MYLVTGGAGFIGSNIAAALSEQGQEVVICDRLGRNDKWRNLARTRVYDIVFPEDVCTWLSGNFGRLAGIIHMGAINSTTEIDADNLVRNNISMSLRLWECAAQYKLPFVYASSAATYGAGEHGFRDDEMPDALAALTPLNAYGWSKHVIDRRFVADVRANRAQPPQWIGLKFFNVYGPNEAHKGDMRSMVHKVHPSVVAGETVELFKSYDPRYRDGWQMRDFIYVKDCVKIVLWLLHRPSVSGLFNAGTGKARSFHDLVMAVGEAVGRNPVIRYVDMPLAIRDRYQYRTEANMTKLIAHGYPHTFFSLEDGVRDYVTSHLARA
jgi:ADP-L-glycero-D-manno-heptose 6-epimerase